MFVGIAFSFFWIFEQSFLPSGGACSPAANVAFSREARAWQLFGFGCSISLVSFPLRDHAFLPLS